METYEQFMVRYTEKQKKIGIELKALIETTSEVELKKRFFKNFGCINFIDDETQHEIDLAKAYHKIHMEQHPEDHDEHESEPYNCYHVTSCKCGLSTAIDSGD